MESLYDTSFTIDNFKNNGWKIPINAVLNCLRQSQFTALKQTLKCYDKKTILSITKYKTIKEETIYHFINDAKYAEFLEKEYEIPFGFEQFNLPDIDGNTMFFTRII